ncbi:AcrR family transcriptional regulator [Pseudorhizobium tarimense]|uniref:AcrR family transcriptional regulator n=1 Tax=Pseudorhizobium tarimense TaxID=1079109 RepID=A0ABV2HAU7_9HYPH|nr:TetR/AcrR family transcriptional regulator [Pseudorhizobium tarimense]MCJ8520797.1 TetR family transcriptional regulator [Pseudorhizobium tarimense]
MPDMNESATRGQLRRVPKQERSRERIDEILKVSMDLIGRKGIDAVTMKEIASLSGGPIASVYQYFPNKTAIVAMLYERYADEVKTMIETGIAAISRPEDAFAAIDFLVDGYFQKVKSEPAIQDLLNAAQADKGLAALDLEQSRVHSRIFAEATRELVPQDLREEYDRMVLMMFHLAAGAIRLALLVGEKEEQCMIQNFKKAANVQFQRFITVDEGRRRSAQAS